MPFDTLALDATNRTYDKDRRLHVRVSHISKAGVNPYRGREIPYSESLGLDPDRVYQLLRDPRELARSVTTWNGLPLMIKHRPQSADDHERDIVVGSLGTDASFDDPYLDNSLTVWDGEAIALIESGAQRQISGGYHYRADMTPGTFQGQPFDGVMRDIVGNHTTLVEAGRAGADVMVMDAALGKDASVPANISTPNSEPGTASVPDAGSDPAMLTPVSRTMGGGDPGPPEDAEDGDLLKALAAAIVARRAHTSQAQSDNGAMDAKLKETSMSKKPAPLSPHDAAVAGALQVYLPAKMAKDQALPDLTRVLAGRPTTAVIVNRITRATQGRLAADASLEDLSKVLDALKPGPDDAMAAPGEPAPEMLPDQDPPPLDPGPIDPENTNAPAEDDDIEEKVRELLMGKLDDADLEMLLKLIRPEETSEEPPQPIDQSDAPPVDAGSSAPPPKDDDPAKDNGLPRPGGAMDRRQAHDQHKEKPVDKVAMDAAIRVASERAVLNAISQTTARLNARADAERFVRPWIGEVALAMDTADDVYRLALDTLGVVTKDVHPSAFKAMLALVPKPGDALSRPARLAHDAATVAALETRFPDLKNARVVG